MFLVGQVQGIKRKNKLIHTFIYAEKNKLSRLFTAF